MKLERSIEQYRNGKPEVIVKGSEAQVLFALQDSRKDVLTLATEVDLLTEEIGRVERNRDMYRGQVERQSSKIGLLRDASFECEEYFDNRADADCDQDGFIPNEEMKLLQVVREALKKAGA